MRSGTRRTTIAATALALALLAPPALAAEPGPTLGPTEDGWTIVSQEPHTHTYFHDGIGEWVTQTGTLTVSVPAAAEPAGAALADIGVLACGRTEWAGDPRKVRQSAAPYANYVVNSAYKQISSGCSSREYTYLTLRERQPIAFPTVDQATGYAHPGGARLNLSVDFKCGSATHGYRSSSDIYYNGVSATVRLCP